jgi:hypothetical protein
MQHAANEMFTRTGGVCAEFSETAPFLMETGCDRTVSQVPNRLERATGESQ